MNFSNFKSTLISRIRMFFAVVTTTLSAQYGVVEEALVQTIEEATDEEIKAILEKLDNAGYHLLKAFKSLREAFAYGANVADRASDTEEVKEKMSQFVEKSGRFEAFFEETFASFDVEGVSFESETARAMAEDPVLREMAGIDVVNAGGDGQPAETR